MTDRYRILLSKESVALAVKARSVCVSGHPSHFSSAISLAELIILEIYPTSVRRVKWIFSETTGLISHKFKTFFICCMWSERLNFISSCLFKMWTIFLISLKLVPMGVKISMHFYHFKFKFLNTEPYGETLFKTILLVTVMISFEP